jgi:hypothetical protein
MTSPVIKSPPFSTPPFYSPAPRLDPTAASYTPSLQHRRLIPPTPRGYANAVEGDHFQQTLDKAVTHGYHTGLGAGYKNGVTHGRTAGRSEGFDAGRKEGFEAGSELGFVEGQQKGIEVGRHLGFDEGVLEGMKRARAEKGRVVEED